MPHAQLHARNQCIVLVLGCILNHADGNLRFESSIAFDCSVIDMFYRIKLQTCKNFGHDAASQEANIVHLGLKSHAVTPEWHSAGLRTLASSAASANEFAPGNAVDSPIAEHRKTAHGGC